MSRFVLVAATVATAALTACNPSSSTSESTVAPTTAAARDAEPTTIATNDTPAEPLATTVPVTGPTTDPTTGPTTAADGGPITLESVGFTFTLPDGFVSDDAATQDAFYATREAPDRAVLLVIPCPDCTRDEMDDGETTLTETTIDGNPAILGETSAQGETVKGVLILAEGQQVIATIVGSNIDDSWDAFVDSIKITPI